MKKEKIRSLMLLLLGWGKVFKQKVEGLLTNLTGRHIHASSEQVSQGAVFCHLLLTGRTGQRKTLKHKAKYMGKNEMWNCSLEANNSAGLILTVLSGSAADGLISST